jgi:hypothetical protein
LFEGLWEDDECIADANEMDQNNTAELNNSSIDPDSMASVVMENSQQ